MASIMPSYTTLYLTTSGTTSTSSLLHFESWVNIVSLSNSSSLSINCLLSGKMSLNWSSINVMLTTSTSSGHVSILHIILLLRQCVSALPSVPPSGQWNAPLAILSKKYANPPILCKPHIVGYPEVPDECSQSHAPRARSPKFLHSMWCYRPQKWLYSTPKTWLLSYQSCDR